jgi:hypothetical protein
MSSCTNDDAWNKYKFQDIILQELRNLLLVQNLRIQRSGASFSLHPLVQDWMKLRISSKSRRAYTIEATSVLSDFIEAQGFHEMAFDAKQMTLSHLEFVIQNDQEYFNQQNRAQDTVVLDATSRLTTFLERMGRYKAAEELCRRAFEGRYSLLGKSTQTRSQA